MDLEQLLIDRSGNRCEISGKNGALKVYTLPPADEGNEENSILIDENYLNQMLGNTDINPVDWQCLNESIWSTIPAIQVLSWRMLQKLRSESWALNLLDMAYLDEETLQWAKEGQEEAPNGSAKHLDCNGAELQTGDTVVLTKDLNVKGAGFTAKRGTAVRRISLVADEPTQIEGRVNDQKIVILTEFVKKSR
ncbi:PhnA domain-containing protein [Membranihabitans maritimus]|uniref:PhnA domain-containing protein n=1 Tax=Membranihabitans maritimus TaxID=2904244 RepID=UPI001F1C2A6E|nr:alkylphosphonate utilization protein [Membranihabitans maritimus]